MAEIRAHLTDTYAARIGGTGKTGTRVLRAVYLSQVGEDLGVQRDRLIRAPGRPVGGRQFAARDEGGEVLRTEYPFPVGDTWVYSASASFTPKPMPASWAPGKQLSPTT
jgi:hypothetical protein